MLKNQIRIPHLVHHFKNINLSWIPYRPLFLRTRENSSSSWHQSSKNKPADKIWLRTLSLHSIRPNLWSSISFIRSPPIIETVWKRSFISTMRQLHLVIENCDLRGVPFIFELMRYSWWLLFSSLESRSLFIDEFLEFYRFINYICAHLDWLETESFNFCNATGCVFDIYFNC